MWKRLALTFLLCLSLSSCSALAPLAKDVLLGGAQKGVELKANAGKAETQGDDNVAQNANTAVSVDAGSKEVFEGPVETVVNEAGLPLHVLFLLVLLAGWAIPSPEEMGHGVVRLIRALRGLPNR
jgi:hypothetical protein